MPLSSLETAFSSAEIQERRAKKLRKHKKKPRNTVIRVFQVWRRGTYVLTIGKLYRWMVTICAVSLVTMGLTTLIMGSVMGIRMTPKNEIDPSETQKGVYPASDSISEEFLEKLISSYRGTSNCIVAVGGLVLLQSLLNIKLSCSPVNIWVVWYRVTCIPIFVCQLCGIAYLQWERACIRSILNTLEHNQICYFTEFCVVAYDNDAQIVVCMVLIFFSAFLTILVAIVARRYASWLREDENLPLQLMKHYRDLNRAELKTKTEVLLKNRQPLRLSNNHKFMTQSRNKPLDKNLQFDCSPLTEDVPSDPPPLPPPLPDTERREIAIAARPQSPSPWIPLVVKICPTPPPLSNSVRETSDPLPPIPLSSGCSPPISFGEQPPPLLPPRSPARPFGPNTEVIFDPQLESPNHSTYSNSDYCKVAQPGPGKYFSFPNPPLPSRKLKPPWFGTRRKTSQDNDLLPTLRVNGKSKFEDYSVTRRFAYLTKEVTINSLNSVLSSLNLKNFCENQRNLIQETPLDLSIQRNGCRQPKKLESKPSPLRQKTYPCVFKDESMERLIITQHLMQHEEVLQRCESKQATPPSPFICSPPSFTLKATDEYSTSNKITIRSPKAIERSTQTPPASPSKSGFSDFILLCQETGSDSRTSHSSDTLSDTHTVVNKAATIDLPTTDVFSSSSCGEISLESTIEHAAAVVSAEEDLSIVSTQTDVSVESDVFQKFYTASLNTTPSPSTAAVDHNNSSIFPDSSSFYI